MLLKFVVVEYFTFFVVLVGAFVLAHLGFLLIERIDAFLSPKNSAASRVHSSTKRTPTN